MRQGDNDRLLRVSEAAAYLGVSSAALRSWSDRGHVRALVTPGGQRRYSREELDRFILWMQNRAAQVGREG